MAGPPARRSAEQEQKGVEGKAADGGAADLMRFSEDNPNPVLQVTGDGTVRYANPSARRLAAIFTDSSCQRLSGTLAEAASRMAADKVVLDLGRQSLAFHVVPVTALGCVNLYGHDITEQLVANRRAINLAKFPSENPNPVLRVTGDGKVYYANEGAANVDGIFEGQEQKQLNGALTLAVAQAAAAQQPREVEFTAGRRIWTFALTPVANEDYINLYGREVTEERRLQKAFEESREMLREIIDAVPAIINVKNRDGQFVLANPVQAAFYGLTPEDLVGRRVEEVADQDYAALTKLRDDAVLQSGEASLSYDDPSLDPEGRPTTWYTTKVPLHGLDGAVSGVLTVSVDITERKEAEDRLAFAKAEAEQAAQAKGQFLANMSHELRTPLNAIIGFTRLVQRRSEGLLPDKQNDNLAKILISAEQLLSLINTILDLSKIEAGQMQVHRTVVALPPLIEECILALEPLALGKSLELVPKIAEGLPELHSDPEKLKQILMNLLSNAIKFTETGHIDVAARCQGNHVAITICDTGIGIPEDEQVRIFEEFHQVDASTTREYGGTGLGLSISRHLARLIDGEITVESKAGRGSAFTLRLPHK